MYSRADMEACNFYILFFSLVYVYQLSCSRGDIESCNFVFASLFLQDIVECNVYVYRLTCSRADMGVGEWECWFHMCHFTRSYNPAVVVLGAVFCIRNVDHIFRVHAMNYKTN